MNTTPATDTGGVVGTAAVDTVIIGAGQSGLALGYYLAQQHRNFVILDAGTRVGDAWRSRWDSLRLFTPAKYNGLPGPPFPGDPLAFPTKDEQADYLEDYASRFHLPVRPNTAVTRLSHDGQRFHVTAGTQRWTAANVVLATGACQLPKTPGFAAELPSYVVQIHSHNYKNPAQLKPGPVLVVGVGNSGAEIALETSRTHETWLAGKPSAEIPFRHGRTAARFFLPVVRFAGMHVLNTNTPVGRKVLPKIAAMATPLIRTKLADLGAAGVHVVPRVTGIQDGGVILDDGQSLPVANVIWCTGFTEAYPWLDIPALPANGREQQHRGIVDALPGLYLLGKDLIFAAASETLPGVCRTPNTWRSGSPPPGLRSTQRRSRAGRRHNARGHVLGAPGPAGVGTGNVGQVVSGGPMISMLWRAAIAVSAGPSMGSGSGSSLRAAGAPASAVKVSKPAGTVITRQRKGS